MNCDGAFNNVEFEGKRNSFWEWRVEKLTIFSRTDVSATKPCGMFNGRINRVTRQDLASVLMIMGWRVRSGNCLLKPAVQTAAASAVASFSTLSSFDRGSGTGGVKGGSRTINTDAWGKGISAAVPSALLSVGGAPYPKSTGGLFNGKFPSI